MTPNDWFDRNPRKTLLFVNLAFLCLVEIVLRLGFGDELLETPSAAVRPSSLTHHDYLPGAVFTTEPYAGDSFLPAENRINSFGIRGPETSAKTACRILLVGDSFVQADETSFDDTFGQLLSRHFGDRAEFIAHGMVSWAPTTEFSWIHHKGLSLSPDEIVLFLCINDFFRATVFHQADQVYRQQAVYEGSVPVGYRLPQPGRLRSALARVATLRLLYRGLRRARSQLVADDPGQLTIPHETILLSHPASTWPPDLRRTVDETLQVVADLGAYLQQRNVEFKVLLVPLGFAWPDEIRAGKQLPPYGWKADFSVAQDGLETHVREALQNCGIAWIDLRAAFGRTKQEESNLLFNEVDGHWNTRGHRVVFEALRSHYEGRFARDPE